MTARFNPYEIDSVHPPMRPRPRRRPDWFPILMGALLVMGVFVMFALAAQARWFGGAL